MKYLLNISFILLAAVSFGQLEDPIVGAEFGTVKKENFSGFIGENATAIFTVDYLYLNRKKQELNIRKFHKSDLQLIDARNIYIPPEGDYYSEPTEVYFQNDKIYLFSTMFGEKGNPNLLGLEIFNDNMERMSSGIVDTLDMDEVIIIKESKEVDGFMICRYNQYSKLTEQEIVLSSINSKGVVSWKRKVKSPMALQNLTIEDLIFSNNSSVYVLCNYAFELKNKNAISSQDMINNKYALWAYDPQEDFLKEFELRLKGKWINGIRLGLNESNDLVVSGYINETRNYAISGVFSLLIDEKLEVLNSSFTKFDDEVRKKFIEQKDMKKITELDDYLLNELLVQDDGSFFLVGERFYKYIERNYDPRTNITTTTEHYNYNSIIVSRFDSLGNHLWSERIPKYQNSTNDYGYFASFSALNARNGIYLFFNDTDKNNEMALTDYFNYKGLFNNRRAQISYVHVNSDGVQDRGPLLGSDNSFMLRAKQCRQISDDVMYLLGENGRNSKVFSVSPKSE